MRRYRAIALLFVLASSLAAAGVAHAASAVDQLCGAAGYGPGCIKAFKPAPTPMMRSGGMSSGGGMFGGVAGAIAVMTIFSALDAGDSSLFGDAGGAPDPALQARAEALREAVERQRRLEQERQDRLMGQMRDAPASQLLDSPQDLAIMEDMRAAAGAPFDGNAPLGSNVDWAAAQDAWFSPEAIGNQAGASIVPLGGQRLSVSPGGMQPLQCAGRLCPFPHSMPPAITLHRLPPPLPKPISTPSPPPGGGPGVLTEVRETPAGLVWSAGQPADVAGQAQTQLSIYFSGASLYKGKGVMGDLQKKVADKGRDFYQRLVSRLMEQIMDMLNDLVYGRHQEAMAKSDQIDRNWAQGMQEYKLVEASLGGDAKSLMAMATDKTMGYAQGQAKQFYLDQGKHWLKRLGKGGR
ncbi:MAG: hypothetical protein ACOZHQ_00420 [Thermodesulfobacteriota bacterium]